MKKRMAQFSALGLVVLLVVSLSTCEEPDAFGNLRILVIGLVTREVEGAEVSLLPSLLR
ncbi:MAG: hypothetical protein HC880_09185 [Bacteroidia bacterium]|nr:hypothetical protein [Bacteroidia bacterium]